MGSKRRHAPRNYVYSFTLFSVRRPTYWYCFFRFSTVPAVPSSHVTTPFGCGVAERLAGTAEATEIIRSHDSHPTCATNVMVSGETTPVRACWLGCARPLLLEEARSLCGEAVLPSSPGQGDLPCLDAAHPPQPQASESFGSDRSCRRQATRPS